ncbi:MAG: glycoside hydrolase family 25 protein [Lachnospiraceae bacterium]|nr:glycoside hydrolase family 25 protein [Lachnospiraceae bacterium]
MKKRKHIFRIIAGLLLITVTTSLSLCNSYALCLSKENATGKKLRFYDEQTKKWYKTNIKKNVKQHDYDWSCLVNDKKKNIIRYQDERYTIRKGIDVSHHNGTINWKKVKKAGISFAFIRIGYRGYSGKGSLNIDRQFRKNLKNARKAGIDVGVYFFSQAVNRKEALEEAKFVLKTLNGKKLDLPIVYDPERIVNARARTDKVSGKQFTKNTLAFCNKIKKAGYETMVYSNMYWEAFLFDMKKIEKYPVWYADYKKKPQTPYRFSFWQYTSSGKVKGVPGRVDLNVQFVRKK